VQSGTPYARIETLIRDGGQIMIGTIAPIRGAAIAHDGKKTLVMLKHRPASRCPIFSTAWTLRLLPQKRQANASTKSITPHPIRATNSEPVNAV